MKTKLCFLPLMLLLLSATTLAQQAQIRGRVVKLDKGKESPAMSVVVSAPGGQSQPTSSKGDFTITFPSSVQPGLATRLSVALDGWVIYEPMFGECVTQNASRNFQSLKVILVRKGTEMALSPPRLSLVIARWSTERVKLKAQVKDISGERDALKRELDEYAFLREYAETYGFTLDRFLAEAQKWADSDVSADKEEQARKEYFRKNYDRAAFLAHEAALTAVKALKLRNQQKAEESANVIRRFKLAGNARYEENKFREALAEYNEIDSLFNSKDLSREDLKTEWAETKLLLGNTKQQLGERVAGTESQSLFSESAKDYEQALIVYTFEKLPQDWATTQNNLGNVLSSQGERLAGEAGIRLLEQAVTAYREALKVRTFEQLPQQWAMTQNNLGNVLSSQGERLAGEAGIRLLEQAVTAYREALKVRTFEQLPQDWAMTQNNLGIVLSSQGERLAGEAGIRLLEQAVAAFREALKVRTFEQLPQQWAATQNNLGAVLRSQGERLAGEAGIRLLEQAVTAYREALKVRTFEQLPQQWAGTQNNLGIVLRSQGERLAGEAGIRLLEQAVTAYREALKVYSFEHLPQDWAMTQNNLGIVLRSQGERLAGEAGIRLLEQAVTAYREALKVRTFEHLPQDWAMTQNNLGIVLSSQGERLAGEAGIRLLEQAVLAYREALKVYSFEQLPQQWAATQNNLGAVLRSQGGRLAGEAGIRLLEQAVAAFREALKVRTFEQLPQQWAVTQNNLARAYILLKNWAGAAEAYGNVLKAYPDYQEAYRRANILYHEILFNFEKAFVLHQQWLAQQPDDLSAQVLFAETHLTTGRFAECEQRVQSLLANLQLSTRSKIPLQAIEIAALLALDKSNQVPAKLDALLLEVAPQPADFKVEWQFDGVKHFIRQSDKLAAHRVWLEQLFAALASPDRDALRKALLEVKAQFKK